MAIVALLFAFLIVLGALYMTRARLRSIEANYRLGTGHLVALSIPVKFGGPLPFVEAPRSTSGERLEDTTPSSPRNPVSQPAGRRAPDGRRHGERRRLEVRRKASRLATEGWTGRCAIQGDSEPEWMPCEAVDISEMGAGVVSSAGGAADLTGRSLVVEIWPPNGESVSLRFVGRVRWANLESADHFRVGLEFENVSETEQAKIVSVIEQLQNSL